MVFDQKRQTTKRRIIMTQQQVIANYRRKLLIFSERHGITKACQVFNVSRTTFYKIKKQFVETGQLEPCVRRRPKMPNETSLSKKKLLLKLVKEHPTRGPAFYRGEFRKLGVEIAGSVIWYHLKRFGLNNRYKRLVYLEQLKDQNQPLTEKTLRQIQRHCETIKHGLWPGHIVALDTFFVGHLKGVGRIYQITGIDLCSRYGWAQLYLSKEQTSSIDFVEHHLIPKFFQNGVELESVLTDNGSEFIATKFNQLLVDYEIEHHRIPKGKPIFNGYCERFQRTILEEFYKVIFRKQFFNSLQELNAKLQEYLVYYNFQRLHFGLDKNGALPINAFRSKRSFLRHRFQNLLT
jgi:transposase InsO family protein